MCIAPQRAADVVGSGHRDRSQSELRMVTEAAKPYRRRSMARLPVSSGVVQWWIGVDLTPDLVRMQHRLGQVKVID